MPSRWAWASLAVPMSMPAYSCMESALMTSPSSACASRRARSDLPAAVAPTTATTGCGPSPVCTLAAPVTLVTACGDSSRVPVMIASGLSGNVGRERVKR